MANLTEISKKLYVTPAYATVGAYDLAFDQVRSTVELAGERVQSLRNDPQAFAKDAVAGVQALPNTLVARGKEIGAKVEAQYDSLASRGEARLEALRKQQEKATSDVISSGKDAYTSARKQAEDVQARTLKAVQTTRKEAAQVVKTGAARVGVVADKVEAEADHEVRSSAAKSSTPAKRTPAKKTTAKKAPAKKTAN